MEKNKNNYGIIIFLVVLVILFVPIISDYVKKQNIEVLSNKTIKEKIAAKESFVLYVGDLEKSVSKKLIKVRDLTKTDNAIEYNVYNKLVSSSFLPKTASFTTLTLTEDAICFPWLDVFIVSSTSSPGIYSSLFAVISTSIFLSSDW